MIFFFPWVRVPAVCACIEECVRACVRACDCVLLSISSYLGMAAHKEICKQKTRLCGVCRMRAFGLNPL
uniref:Putative secreted protein n=1 Tax=Anopheles darlingi TaxID=43151 RepID=A0A2M4DET3_ANODA